MKKPLAKLFKKRAGVTKKIAKTTGTKGGSSKTASTQDTLSSLRTFLDTSQDSPGGVQPNGEMSSAEATEGAKEPASKGAKKAMKATKAMKAMKATKAVKAMKATKAVKAMKATKAMKVLKQMKRPASATKTMGAAIVGAADPEKEPRDRMKNYYFHEQLKGDTLDPELRELWDKVRGNRKKETMLINGCMAKAPNGKFKVDRDSPKFQELSTRINNSYWRDEHRGIPESLAIVKFKGEAALRAAIDRGDVKETVDQGQKFYSWRTITIGRGGKSETSHVVSKRGMIDDQTYQKLSGMISKVGWAFNFSEKQQKATEDGKPLPREALGKVEMARAALEKISKTAVSTLSSMKQHPKSDLVQKAHAQLTQKLKQIRTSQNELENLAVLETTADGSHATCSDVLAALGTSAQVLEDTFTHLKACSGLLKGSK